MTRTHRNILSTAPVPPTTRPERGYPLDVAAIEAWQARQEITQAEYRDHKFAESCSYNHRCPYRYRLAITHTVVAKRSRDKRRTP